MSLLWLSLEWLSLLRVSWLGSEYKAVLKSVFVSENIFQIVDCNRCSSGCRCGGSGAVCAQLAFDVLNYTNRYSLIKPL